MNLSSFGTNTYERFMLSFITEFQNQQPDVYWKLCVAYCWVFYTIIQSLMGKYCIVVQIHSNHADTGINVSNFSKFLHRLNICITD